MMILYEKPSSEPKALPCSLSVGEVPMCVGK